MINFNITQYKITKVLFQLNILDNSSRKYEIKYILIKKTTKI